jgi:hypothetical protein
MLKILQSIFGNTSKGSYPESLINEAIERAVDGTDPCLRAVSGYRKKLRPAIIRAIDHVIAMVDRLPPAVPLSLAGYTDDKLMKGFFISSTDMKKILAGDRALADFVAGPEGDSPTVHALLAMERQERGIFGAALSGDVIIRDVPQTTVSFDLHRFLNPSGNEQQNRRQLMRRAFDHLLGLALRRLAGVKSERKDLERWRTLLQSKLNLLERGGWGFEGDGASGDSGKIEEQLAQIEAQLKELGGDDRMYEAYLEIVVEMLGHPDEYFTGRNETIFVDRMGIKREGPADNVAELPLIMLYNAEGQSQVVLPVTLQGAELRELLGDKK